MSGCYPKEIRLRKRREYLAVQRGGTTWRSRYFLVVTRSDGSGRVGITVSKKVGTAVRRNRVKRVVREFVRQRRGDADWLPACADAVIIARAGAATASTRDLWADLDQLGREVARC